MFITMEKSKNNNSYIKVSHVIGKRGSFMKVPPITMLWYFGVLILVVLSVVRIYFTLETYSGGDRVIVCYYNVPNYSEPNQLLPANIQSHLCTHINVAFAEIRNCTIYLTDPLKDTLSLIIRLKLINPKLKILLSIGGAGQNNGFPKMVQDHASRKLFIKSIKYVLKNFSLDGIDLDWEFPGVADQTRKYHSKKGRRERQHFSQLLREIKAEFQREKRDYLLTVAVAAPEMIVNVAYDVDQLNLYADFVNIMTYDFHFYSKYTPFTGLNSPIYSASSELFYLATLNINYTVNMYVSKGLDHSKIVVGIPTYGHSFTLVNKDNNKVGSPASGFGTLGRLGFVLYPDICLFLENYASETTLIHDNTTKVPYFFKSFEWVSFEDQQSVSEKAKFINENDLGGAMIYSLSADDFEGVCRKEWGNKTKFPLSQAIRHTLNVK